MIVLKSLKAKNFKSWKNLEIDNIDKLGLTLIQGQNGSGKTSCRHAIEYLLLDTFSEPMNVTDIPFNKDSECILEGIFQKDNDEIKIIKYRNHKKKGQAIELWLNGSDSLTHTDRRETQKEVLKLFGIDSFTVQTTSIYSSNSKSFIESTDIEKKEIVYNVLGLHKFNKGKDKAKQKVKELESVIETSSNDIENIKNTIASQEDDLIDVIQQIKDYDTIIELRIHQLESDIQGISLEHTDHYEKEVSELSTTKHPLVSNDEIQKLEGELSEAKDNKLKKKIELKNIVETIEIQKKELISVTEKLNNYDGDKWRRLDVLVKSLDNYKIVSFKDLESKVDDLRNSKKDIDQDAIDILEDSINDYKNNKLIKERDLENERTKLKNSGDGKCPVIKDFHCEHLIAQRDKIIESCEPIIKSLEIEVQQLKETISTSVRELNSLRKIEESNSDIDFDIETCKDKIKEIETNNRINESKVKDIKDNITNLKKESNPYIDIKNNIRISKGDGTKKLESEIDNLTTSCINISTIINIMKEKDKFNNDIDAKIQGIKEKISEIETDNKIKVNRIQDIKKTIASTKSELNPYTKFRKKITKSIKTNKSNIKNIKDKQGLIYDELLYFKFWLNGFGKTGLPNMLSESFLISLEDETNKILSSISDQMHITISSQKENKDKSISEKIDVQIHHPDKTITSVGAYSAGQRQRVKLANLFALHNLISDIDFMILDESLEGSLDQEGKEAIIELLNTQAKDIGTLFVISQDETIKDSFDSIINIGIKDGVSHLLN